MLTRRLSRSNHERGMILMAEPSSEDYAAEPRNQLSSGLQYL